MESTERLVGEWVSDPEDAAGQSVFGRATLLFRSIGHLLYSTTGSDGQHELILLEYRVQNDHLITNQPSAPSVERSTFSFPQTAN
jgi:hypothetical protein